ncbi:DnaJ domain protein [Teladorsagia circumcincta]|uniref:DnaJ domain protein n=1 Tax=Teladorsagia circumcincta TaxID=45464 RepID=A0A2G9UNX9_TELCI|nr:DnaJ domain protein [Teladorsagia circumcincta]
MAPGPIRGRQFASEPVVDYYAVLGVKPGATAKEIKAAFYDLSKKYHPDRNRDNQAEAATKFHQVSLAYEVLGSDEKRKMYDMTRIRTSPDLSSTYARRASTSAPTKSYTDMDIDYKSFEHFQRLNRQFRQRKQYHSHFDMPEEFYAEFGGKRREFKSTYEPFAKSIHRDSRARQREEEERQREIQREQERLQAKYPIPTFEQMLREKRRKQEEESRKQAAGALGLATAAAVIYFIVKKFFR